MQADQNNVEVVDVAIVGGGPTGLFSGLLLHRLGVSIRILDAKPQSLDFGRADALNARTQQYLEVAGLLDELLQQGLKCNTSSTFGDGDFKSRQNEWWVSLEHTLHKNFLMIGQPVVEAMLSNRLEGLIHYGEQVDSITEQDEFVEIVTSTGRRVQSSYAIGADGARSMVRKAIGASFTGTKPEMLWAVLDTFIDTDFPTCPEIITFQLDGQSRVSWIPRERGLCRFYVLLDGEVNQERAEESIKKHMAPYRADFVKTEWYSTFDVKERIASTFVSRDGAGRILLGGDAAHVHSVNGGQGLNTGMADAFSISWRLALVLKNSHLQADASDKLIRSYDTERRQTAQGVIDVAAALVRDTVHTAKQYVGTIQRNAGYITGMGVSYHGFGSPMVDESEHGFWKAGNRCPDVVLKKQQSGGHVDETRLYSEVAYGKFIILAIGKASEYAGDSAHVNVATYINIVPHEASVSADATETETTKTFKAEWVTPEESYAIVIRPDMYIGHVGSDVRSCEQYLDGLFHSSKEA
ncbi:FAD-dependent monooxygenase terD-like protein [Cladobotryum mycophilum]|uniref:FAD-dependent monooxygenase terD-like protein n=1 Tax=Cladobotryum mycophilum TaxID=491253 RepID=A0ABR0SWA7_9HYPO